MRTIDGTTIVGSEGRRVMVEQPREPYGRDGHQTYSGTVAEVIDSDFFTVRWDGADPGDPLTAYIPANNQGDRWFWL